MKRTSLIISTIVVLALVVTSSVLLYTRHAGQEGSSGNTHTASMNTATSTLRITSPAFAEGTPIPAEYTCDAADGGSTNPPLAISGVPEGAKSLVLFVEDPDAPGRTWDHWVVFNMDPGLRAVAKGVQPPGTAGKGSSGSTSYRGPCPPSGSHRYVFTVSALDAALTAPPGSTKADVAEAMTGHVLAEARLMGIYSRQVR